MYLAELSVCVTVWFKICLIVRIYARRVPHIHREKRLDDDAILADSGIND